MLKFYLFYVNIKKRKDDYVLKKAFLIISMLITLILCSVSVSAFEGVMTSTHLVSNSNGYTFESVITPTVTAECMPIIAMYDSDGLLCGLMYGDTLSLTLGTPVIKTFTVSPDSAPSSIKLMLWKTDGSFAPLCRFEQVSTALYSEKYGMIVEASQDTGVKLYTSDASSAVTYDFADTFTLSYGSTVISDKTSAYNYINSLRLVSYTYKGKEPIEDWIIKFADGVLSDYDVRYKTSSGNNADLWTYADYLDNYSARMVRILVSNDNKIGSMAFADDNLFDKLSKGKAYSRAFYTQSEKSFNDSLDINDNTKILYFPARAYADISQFTRYAPSTLSNGNLYYLREFTTYSGEQIILVTHMFTDDELEAFNSNPVENINIALNGNGSNLNGISNDVVTITVTGQTTANNTKATTAANYALEEVAKGLEGALVGADNGYAITREYVKIKFKTHIDVAKEYYQTIKDLDASLDDSPYLNAFENEIVRIIGVKAAGFLKDYFLNN